MKELAFNKEEVIFIFTELLNSESDEKIRVLEKIYVWAEDDEILTQALFGYVQTCITGGKSTNYFNGL